MKKKLKIIAFVIVATAAFSLNTIKVVAQDTAKSAAANPSELAKKLANPIANLISVPFQSNWDVGAGDNNGSRIVLNFQPVIPIKLSPKLNLITRWILPIISQKDITGEKTNQSGLGDAVITGFFSPSNSKLVWGIGPAIIVPTATDKLLGSEKFSIGPSIVILKQSKGWTIGGLANHVFSIAGSESRSNVSATYLNPFFGYNWKSGAGITLNAEFTHDWEHDLNVVVVQPIASAVTKFGKQIVSFGVGPRLHFAPSGHPDYGVRAVLTLVFPK